MANLAELRNLLQTLARDGGSAKVSFYYVGEDGVAMRNGGILVDAGRQAYLDHQGLPAAQAVDAIMGLKLIKIASLQMSEVRPAPGQQAVALQDLIAYLDAPAPPTPAAAPPPPSPAPAAPAAVPDPPPTATTEREALPSIDVKAEALRLLEPLFGVSAIRKVDEFAIAHPPMQHPYEFLLLCQKHTAIMLGAPKAEALFRPLYDLLAAERLQHRRR